MSTGRARRSRRIAIVSHTRARIGGVESYVATLVPALCRAGHTVGCWFETAGHGADPVILPDGDVPSWVAAEHADAGLGALAAWQPDVVYAHGVESVVARARPDAPGAAGVLRALLLRRVRQRHQVVARAGRAAVRAHPRSRLPGALLSRGDAVAGTRSRSRASTFSSAIDSSCFAATRASWWRAGTWPTSTHGTAWDHRCGSCRCRWNHQRPFPRTSGPTIQAARGGCSSSAGSR